MQRGLIEVRSPIRGLIGLTFMRLDLGVTEHMSQVLPGRRLLVDLSWLRLRFWHTLRSTPLHIHARGKRSRAATLMAIHDREFENAPDRWPLDVPAWFSTALRRCERGGC
jgi:hypothetical protein